MGIGYTAGALHNISYMDDSQMTIAAEGQKSFLVKLLEEKSGLSVDERVGPLRFRSPSQLDIIAWREGIARKCQDHLGEELSWDEASDFIDSEDIASSADMLFRHVAAVLDQGGPASVCALRGTPQPPYPELDAVFARAEQRKFSGRFPQLLLGAATWLPFQRHLILEEPDWEGHKARFGSTFQFADEIREVRSAIGESDPGAMVWRSDQPTQKGNVLAAAWQASEAISRICASAVAQGLPLWWSG